MSVGKMCLSEIRPPPNVKGRSNCIQSDDAIQKQCIGNILDADECSVSPNSNSPTPPLLRRYERNTNGERNFGLLRQLSQRFGLRSYDDPIDSSANDDDNHSSSTDSCSSSQTTITINAKSWELQQEKLEQKPTKVTPHNLNDSINTIDDLNDFIEQQQNMVHDATHDGNETVDKTKIRNETQPQQIYYNSKDCRCDNRRSCTRLQRRSTSTIRKAFESFSLTTRSLSCSSSTLPPKSEQYDSEYNASRNSNNASPIRSPFKYASNSELHKKTRDMTIIVSNQQHQEQQQRHLYETRNRNMRSLAHDTNHSSVCNITLDTANKTNKSKQPPQRILRQPVSYTYLKGISGLPTQRVPRNSVCCQYARR